MKKILETKPTYPPQSGNVVRNVILGSSLHKFLLLGLQYVTVIFDTVESRAGNSNFEGKRKTVRVIGVNFSKSLIKGKEI